jgi:hypothetical protein
MKFKTMSVSVLLFLSASAFGVEKQWQYLLDNELSKWELWMGVPHSSIKGLPSGTHTSEKIFSDILGRGMGLNNDPKKVFSVKQHGGEKILSITGEIFGGLTTLNDYENYHLSLQVKWGEKKWPPRLELARDTGLLFHCRGDHGVLWFVWKSCLEFQIMEDSFGDFLPLVGTSGKVRADTVNNGEVDYFRFNPSGSVYSNETSFVKGGQDVEKAHGEWNHLELYSVGTKAAFVVNGVIVMFVEEAKDKYGNALSAGQIQLQSEGAEVYYKDIKIRPINEFPAVIMEPLNVSTPAR